MSALQASRMYKVPSRTLYDKVKKLGITAGRPMNRTIKRSPSNNGGPAAFPYGISGTRNPYGHNIETVSHNQSTNESENGSDIEREREREHVEPQVRKPSHHIPLPAAALLEATFLQQALEARNTDIAGRDALNAMAFAAAAHAQLNGISVSPTARPVTRSPSPSAGSGSGGLVNYMRSSTPKTGAENDEPRQTTPSPPHTEQTIQEQSPSPSPQRKSIEESDDLVDLSMGKTDKESVKSDDAAPTTVPQQLGVIVPPISKGNKDEIQLSIKREITIDDK